MTGNGHLVIELAHEACSGLMMDLYQRQGIRPDAVTIQPRYTATGIVLEVTIDPQSEKADSELPGMFAGFPVVRDHFDGAGTVKPTAQIPT